MTNPNSTRSLRRWLVAPAIVGALAGGYGIAAAQTDATTTTTTPADATTTTVAPPASDSATTAPAQSDAATPPAGRRGGEGETALTGETAEKVKATALKAVPGATVDRVETDNDGSPYEAHMTKPDGSHVTVKVNENFEVTSVETDPMGDHHGGRGPGGGSGEMALTGETADKVKAAALKAVPDATVDRVENDNEGSPYEAHMTKSDGSHVTVKVNENFEVTSVQADPGPGGPR